MQSVGMPVSGRTENSISSFRATNSTAVMIMRISTFFCFLFIVRSSQNYVI